MISKIFENDLIQNKMLAKFRGTFYGVLVGDCFGALFQENSILSKGSRLVLRNFLDGLEKGTGAVGVYENSALSD